MQSACYEHAVSLFRSSMNSSRIDPLSISPHSQMPLSIAFLPNLKQRGMTFHSTITLRTRSDNGEEEIVLQRSLTGQWL